jgi:hypothetical protein
VGYTVGLVIGSIFVGTIGWRWTFYLAAIVNMVFLRATV